MSAAMSLMPPREMTIKSANPSHLASLVWFPIKEPSLLLLMGFLLGLLLGIGLWFGVILGGWIG